MSWIHLVLPVFFGTLAMSSISLSQRWGLKERPSPLPFLICGFVLVSGTLGLIYLARWGVSMPAHLLPGFWTAVFVGTAANYAIQFLGAKASTIKEGDASFVAPLSAMTPGLVTVVSFALGEMPGTAGLIGIVLIAAGTWVLLFPKEPQHWWQYLGPIYRLSLIFHYHSLPPEEKGRARVVWMMFGAACFATVGMICDGLYVRRGSDTQGMVLALTVLTSLLAVGYIVQYCCTGKPADQAPAVDRRLLLALLVWVAGWVIHLFLIQPAYTESYIAYVGSLKRLSVLLTIVLGWALFKEGDIKKRLFAGSLMVAGLLCIGSEDLPTHLTAKIEGFGFL